ncbi:MAG: SIMPL domain-containing protein [Acidimicrobiales bacterium]
MTAHDADPDAGSSGDPDVRPPPRRRRRARLLGAGGLFLLAVAGPAAGAAISPSVAAAAGKSPVSCGAGTPKVTVTGTGTSSATPNLLTLELDVHTTDAEASIALSSNDSVTAAVVHALGTGGVPSSDIQTTDLTIEPNYANTGNVVTGYGVDDTVDARIHHLASAGTLIDAAVAAGGNATRIDSLSYSLTHPLRSQDRARHMAVRQAVAHAKAMAGAAGEHLRGICSLKDDTVSHSTTPPIAFGAVSAKAAAASVPVQAGSETVTARVTIEYELG